MLKATLCRIKKIKEGNDEPPFDSGAAEYKLAQLDLISALKGRQIQREPSNEGNT